MKNVAAGKTRQRTLNVVHKANNAHPAALELVKASEVQATCAMRCWPQVQRIHRLTSEIVQPEKSAIGVTLFNNLPSLCRGDAVDLCQNFVWPTIVDRLLPDLLDERNTLVPHVTIDRRSGLPN